MQFGILVQGPPLSLKIPPHGREVEKSKPDSYLCKDPEELISYAEQDWGCLFLVGPFSGVNQIWAEKAMAPHSSTLAWKIPWTEEPGAAVHVHAKSRTQLSDFTFTFHFHALEKEMAAHSSVLAWRTPGMLYPGGLPSMGVSQSQTQLK